MAYKPITANNLPNMATQNGSVPMQRIDDGSMMVPENPINSVISNPGFSLSGVIARAQTRAATHKEALDLYRAVFIARMKQQADVGLHAGELLTTARKNQQLDAFVEANTELVNQLALRLAEMDDRLLQADFTTILAANEAANLRRADIERRFAEGRIDAVGQAMMLEVVERQLSYRVEASSKRAAQFLQQIDTHIMQTVEAIGSSMKRRL